MTSQTRTYRLLADLLATLETEGLRFGIGAHLRVQELLCLLPPDAPDDELAPALASILARNAAEQNLVAERFADAARRTDELLASIGVETPPPPPTPDERMAERWKWRAIVPAIVLAAVAAWFGWQYFQAKNAPEAIERNFLVRPGGSATVCPAEVLELKNLGESRSVRLVFPQRGGESAFGQFSFDEKMCLRYFARSGIADGQDSLVAEFQFPGGISRRVFFRALIEKAETPPPPPPTKATARDSIFRPKKLPFEHDFVNQCAVAKPSRWEDFLAKNAWWLRLAFFFPLAAALFALWRWLEFRRRKLVARQEKRDKPPYFWNIRIPGAEAEIVLGDGFAFALQVMRRRAGTDARRLDIEKTVQRTAQNAGIPDFRYRQLTQPVDYLLLLDRGDPANHRAHLFDALFRAFRAQEIEIERFFFDSDPQICFNDEHPNGVRLTEIARHFGGARLVVVSNGAQFLSPETARPAAWTVLLENWRERALLSPRPLADWGKDERNLAQIFTVLPATLQSLGFWVDELGMGEDARFEDWQKHVHDAPALVFQPDDQNPMPSLLAEYDRDMLCWIAACAIYPTLHWDLTLWLGREIPDLGFKNYDLGIGRPKIRNPKSQILNTENLLHLFRLRWFVEGEIPQTARLALLNWLESTDKNLLARLREAQAELLRQSPPPPQSAAFDAFALHVALSEWLGTPDPVRKAALEAEIAERLRRGQKPDFTVLKYLNEPQSPLDFLVPRPWKKFVHPGGFRSFGWQKRWKDLLWLLPALGLLAAAFWPYKFREAECVGKSVRIAGQDVCLEQPTCQLLWAEHHIYKVYESGNLPPGDLSLLQAFRQLAETFASPENSMPKPLALAAVAKDSAEALAALRAVFSESELRREVLADSALFQLLAEARQNVAAAAWNRACKTVATDSAATCQLLAEIAALDTLDADYRRALAWCRGERFRNPWRIAPEIAGTVVEAATGKPIFGAEITPGDFPAQKSDARGRFVLRLGADFPRPEIRLRVNAPGFLATDLTLKVDGVKTLPPIALIRQTVVAAPPAENEETDWQAAQIANTEQGFESFLAKWPNGKFAAEARAKIPARDRDADGTPDKTDNCPDEKGDAANNGCPPPIQQPPPATDGPGKGRKSGFEMVTVQGGTFTMGSDDKRAQGDEKPPHQVRLNSYSIGKYEVTQADWREIMLEDPPRLNFKGCDQCPVERVSWDDIQEFLQKLNQKHPGRNYRLPTEAEWEFAARGGVKSKGFEYAGGNDLDAVAWYRENSNSKTHPVGEKTANELGLHDMSGNVWEWCSDWYDDKYYENFRSSAAVNPKGPDSGTGRVLRGGSWVYYDVICRVPNRYYNVPSFRVNSSGFRLSQD